MDRGEELTISIVLSMSSPELFCRSQYNDDD